MICFTPWRWASSLALLCTIAVASSDVRAGFTPINFSHSPRNSREATHEQILEHTYGGDFTADGVNFSNGSVTVTRIDDSADQTWTQQASSARAVAAFAKHKQAFGYFQGDSGGSFNKLFEVSGNQFDVDGSVTDSRLDGSIRFGRNENIGRAFSSLAAENRDGKDHLVSYKVSGPDNLQAPTYLLFWEDKWGKNSDFDFNDLVVEVSTAGQPLLIPLPPAAWSGIAGLAMLGLLTASKRARRWIF